MKIFIILSLICIFSRKDCLSLQKRQTSPCTTNPCNNGGKCIQIGDNIAYCACTNGYVGLNCDLKSSDTINSTAVLQNVSTSNDQICPFNICMNSAKCIVIDNAQLYCNCLPNFTGKYCETKLSIMTTTITPTTTPQQKACPSGISVCQNNGTCFYTDAGSISCKCPLPYNGTFCEKENVFCDLLPCQNGATCNQTGPIDGECVCPPGYSGKTCNTKQCDPNNNPCQNSLGCFEIDGEFECLCNIAYTGKFCETPLLLL